MAAAAESSGLTLGLYMSLIIAYLFLNSSLNLINKWALGHAGFRFPFLLTSCHMLFGFCVLAPVALRDGWESHRATLRKQWRGVACIGAFLALNIALSNISLMDISLSLNQIIRSAIPVVACVLSIVVESKYPSPQEAASLVVLSCGVMLAVWQGTVAGKPYAIALSVAATVSNAAMMTFSSKLMSEKLDVVRLTFYVAPVSLTCLAPFFWIYERESFAAYWPSHQEGAGLIMLVSSIMAIAYNLVHALMIKNVSVVATTVLGEFKIICLLVLSAMLLGEGSEFTFKMTLGCLLAMGGFAAYGHIKIKAAREGVKPPLLATSGSADRDLETQLLKKGGGA
ncbi:putative sugar phosphate/phosphate translocator [Chlorella vulgaris]